MSNWIGVAIWIGMGVVAAVVARIVLRRPETDSAGDFLITLMLGVFAAAIGGMLGVGFFNLYRPAAVAPGPMISAGVFAVAMTLLYRWGIRAMV